MIPLSDIKNHKANKIEGQFPEIPVETDPIEVADRDLAYPYVYVTSKGHKIGYIDTQVLIGLKHMRQLGLAFDVIENIAQGIVAVDSSGKIFYTNRRYREILGIDSNRLIGKNIKDIEREATIIDVLENKEPISKKNNYVKSINRYVDVDIYPIFKDGDFEGAYSIFSDITEFKELTEKYNELSDSSKSANSQLDIIKKMDELNMIGESPEFIKIVRKASFVAVSDASVMILGENGTGKDVLAKFIHNTSDRADKTYVTLNCSAIPETLIESEMFGYEAGSFTGGQKNGKLGKFELANHGTIFLDEVADMSLAMQAKLLRVLETGEIEKIGSEKKHVVDVRVICATNKNIEQMVEDGSFREDLYYRLSVLTLELPSLRERAHDTVLFINHFLKSYNEKYDKNLYFSKEALYYMINYNWPGNIRELKNCVEQAVILTNSSSIVPESLPNKVKAHADKDKFTSLEEAMKDAEARIILNSYRSNNYEINFTAEELVISIRTLYRKINEYKLNDKIDKKD